MIIGIFGGTFNPIHTGHLIITEYCRCLLNMDRILFIPAGIPPHKKAETLPEPKHRYKMVELAVESNPCFDVTDIEIRKNSPSYTIDTVKQLMQDPYYSRHTLQLLIGADSLLDLHTWKSADELLNLIHCVVMKRPGSEPNQTDSRFERKYHLIETPCIQISASEIRERIHQKQSVRYLVPEAVRQYIKQESLYL